MGSSERRAPTGIQRMNQWLLPILTVTIMGAGGAVAEKVWGNNTLLSGVAANQVQVMRGQNEMTKEIAQIKQHQEEVKDTLEAQTAQLKLDRIQITTMHHQRSITTCHGCHDGRKNK